MLKQSSPQVFRITGARQGLEEDVRGRQRRYVISMLVRTAAVVVTALLWDVQRPLAVAALVLGMLLPYIAVVIANAGRENAPSLPGTIVPAPPTTPALTTGKPRDKAGEQARDETAPGQETDDPSGSVG